jgi:hypothetical protein
VRLEIVISPYRATVSPLANYIAALDRERPDITLTVIVPELITRGTRVGGRQGVAVLGRCSPGDRRRCHVAAKSAE